MHVTELIFSLHMHHMLPYYISVYTVFPLLIAGSDVVIDELNNLNNIS